jgi:hypothetical protein
MMGFAAGRGGQYREITAGTAGKLKVRLLFSPDRQSKLSL